MNEPSPSELLAGVAEALEETVIPELPRGSGRNQILAAVGIVRRCGDAADNYGPLLHTGCHDLLITLRDVVASEASLVTEAGTQAFEAALRAGDAVLGDSYPRPSALAEAHAELSEQLAVLVVAAQQSGSSQLIVLRQLLERMAEREAELGLSPW